MRKRRAIALSGSFILLLLAYFAWCLSPFFLKPKFFFEEDIPPDAQAVIREWRPYQSLPSAGIVMREVMRNLANPYGVSRVEAWATGYFESNDRFYVESSPFSAAIERKNGKWIWIRHAPQIISGACRRF